MCEDHSKCLYSGISCAVCCLLRSAITVFGPALCEAGEWSLPREKTSPVWSDARSRTFIAWFERTARPGQTWLDIGANYGYTALYLAGAVGLKGRVFAFEPKRSTCGFLSQTMALNGLSNVTVVSTGLDTSDTEELRRFQTAGSMAVGSSAVEGPSESVLIARLDWLWPLICRDNPRIDGVKIDVQGMALGVL